MKNIVMGYCIALMQYHNGILPKALIAKACYRFFGLADSVVNAVLLQLQQDGIIDEHLGALCLIKRVPVANFTPAVAQGYVIGMLEEESHPGTVVVKVEVIRENAQILCSCLHRSPTGSVADQVHNSVYQLYHANILQGYMIGGDPEVWRVSLRGQLTSVADRLLVIA